MGRESRRGSTATLLSAAAIPIRQFVLVSFALAVVLLSGEWDRIPPEYIAVKLSAPLSEAGEDFETASTEQRSSARSAEAEAVLSLGMRRRDRIPSRIPQARTALTGRLRNQVEVPMARHGTRRRLRLTNSMLLPQHC